jgi:hypothetical protein
MSSTADNRRLTTDRSAGALRHRKTRNRQYADLRITHYALRITNCVPRLLTYTLPLAALLTLVGYFGHRAAGLVVTGLDLGEYVKFLHPVRSGEITLWREGFYLPLIAASVALSLYAYRREMAYPWPLKVLLLIVSGVAALNLLPPAWSPPLLLTPEFRLLTMAMLLCLGLAAISPFLALLPAWISDLIAGTLSVAALWLPVQNFLRVLPAIADLYGHPLAPGWGPWLMGTGLVGMIGSALLKLYKRIEIKRLRD